MQAGLPVLAKINPGTDLQNIIEKEKVGIVYTSDSVNDFCVLAEKIIDNEINYKQMSEKGKNLYYKAKKINPYFCWLQN